MSDSISQNLGQNAEVEIFGGKWSIPQIDLGILGDAESELIKRERPVKEQLEELIPLATLRPEYVDQKADKIIARQKAIPPEEVIAWVSSTVDGIAFSLARQLKMSHPKKFEENGDREPEWSVAKIKQELLKMVEFDQEKFDAMIDKRNAASGIGEEPKNHTGSTEGAEKEEEK